MVLSPEVREELERIGFAAIRDFIQCIFRQ